MSKVMKLVILMACVVCSGCSSVLALKQPSKKDLSVLRIGATRLDVMAELGTPKLTEKKGRNITDNYQFTQGYQMWVKLMRSAFHASADVYTLFLWEFVGMPFELMLFNGQKMTVITNFDHNNLLLNSKIIERK